MPHDVRTFKYFGELWLCCDREAASADLVFTAMLITKQRKCFKLKNPSLTTINRVIKKASYIKLQL